MANGEAPGVKVFQLKRKSGVGFGIALSGGTGQPQHGGQDQGIYISDVVNAGPAQGKLIIGDKLIMVNGKSCIGISRAEVVNMLRHAGQLVSLTVVRVSDVQSQSRPYGANNPTQKQNGHHHAGGPSQHNHSYSSNDKTSYYTEEDEDDYLTQKQPLPESNDRRPGAGHPQHTSSRHAMQPQHQNSSHHNNSTFHPQSEHMSNMPTLEPNNQRSYGNNTGPEDTMTLPVNEPEATRVVISKPPKSTERFGIQFGTQLVVRDIMSNSLADTKHGNELRPGDVIISINGKGVDHLAKEDAMKIAAQNRNRLELLVRKQSGMTVTVPISASNFDQLSDRMGHITMESNQPVQSSHNLAHEQHQPEEAVPEPRQFDDPDMREIVFTKSSKSLGIRLEGGNNVGIFIANIQSNSPAEGRGLRPGDKILEVNGQSFRYTTHEEAINALMSLRQGQSVRIKVKHSPDAFDKCQETGIRDQFYIRTHFKFDGDRNEPQWNVHFNKGEVFLVYDTLYMGQLGNWQASRIDHRNRQGTKSIIPNRSRASQIKQAQDQRLEKLRLGHVNKLLQRFKTGNTLTKAPRHHHSAGTSGPKYAPYERVVLREASFRRPVVFFGPVSDVARDLLVRESGLDFESAEEVHNPDSAPGRKGIVKIQTINDIISRDKHAVLDITPNAVDKLNYAQLYPICVYLKSVDRNRVKEIRDRFHASKKNPKKLIDRAIKLDRSYRHVFTDVLDIDSCGRGREWTDELFRRIHDQQHLLVWVNEQHETVGQEDEELDNEQDRFSYVSAPASDYSVTTVGTEMAYGNRDDPEEEDDEREPVSIRAPKPKQRHSSPQDNRPRHNSNPHASMRQEFDSGESHDVVERPFGAEDLMPAPQQQASQPKMMTDSATSPVHYPPPPRDEMGPGPYAAPSSRQKHAYVPPRTHPDSRHPTTMTRGSQYDYPPREDGHFSQHPRDQSYMHQPREEPRYQPHPAPQTTHEDWPAPVTSSTLQRPPHDMGPDPRSQPYYRDEQAHPEYQVPTSAHPQYHPPPPQHIQHPPRPIQSQPPAHHVPVVHHAPVAHHAPISHEPQSPRTQLPPPSKPTSSSRFDPQAILAQKQADSYAVPQKSHPYASLPRSEQPRSHQPITSSTHSYPAANPPAPQEPDMEHARYVSSRAPQHQSKPLVSSNNANRPPTSQPPTGQKPSGYYMNQAARPFQSSWNPHPRSAGLEIPKGAVSDRINMFAGSSNTRPPRAHSPPAVERQPAPVEQAARIPSPQIPESSVPTTTHQQPKKDVVATARGIFDYNGGVLSSLETGVSLVIPEGAIPYGTQQEIYFKVCQDENSLPTPANPAAGERLMSPMVMCGPHGLKFDVPIELRLPHRPERDPSESLNLTASQPDEESVSILIDHF